MPGPFPQRLDPSLNESNTGVPGKGSVLLLLPVSPMFPSREETWPQKGHPETLPRINRDTNATPSEFEKGRDITKVYNFFIFPIDIRQSPTKNGVNPKEITDTKYRKISETKNTASNYAYI